MRIDNPYMPVNSSHTIVQEYLVSNTNITSNVSTVDISLPPQFSNFVLRLRNIRIGTDSEDLIVQVTHNGFASIDSGATYVWTHELTLSTPAAARASSTSDSSFPLTHIGGGTQLGSTAGEGATSEIFIYGANSPTRRFHMSWQTVWVTEASQLAIIQGSGRNGPTQFVNGVRIGQTGAGGINSGSIKLFGLR